LWGEEMAWRKWEIFTWIFGFRVFIFSREGQELREWRGAEVPKYILKWINHCPSSELTLS
jgi:hypothetical protein